MVKNLDSKSLVCSESMLLAVTSCDSSFESSLTSNAMVDIEDKVHFVFVGRLALPLH